MELLILTAFARNDKKGVSFWGQRPKNLSRMREMKNKVSGTSPEILRFAQDDRNRGHCERSEAISKSCHGEGGWKPTAAISTEGRYLKSIIDFQWSFNESSFGGDCSCLPYGSLAMTERECYWKLIIKIYVSINLNLEHIKWFKKIKKTLKI